MEKFWLFKEKLAYMHADPVKRGLVLRCSQLRVGSDSAQTVKLVEVKLVRRDQW